MSAERPTRQPCETCGGTGRVQDGDGQGETTCPDCAPEARTSDLSGLTAAIGWGLDPTGSTKDPLLGTKIHDVTINRVLADGGMGRVYEGLQDGFGRPVAVKVIRPGYASPEAIRRFEIEWKMLGRLNHPHIAHAYLTGLHPVWGGQVRYFVMEYIKDARSLTAHVRDCGLSRPALLDVFRRVCDAMAYVHTQDPAVVHRDLKPSNILVDREGNPKVIDFGIAKCLVAAPDDTTGLTSTGQIMGSVQYMSPEQFGGDPSAIDARSDVYSLGVILYELLAGKPPYDVRGLNIVEAAHVVFTTPPAWPDDLVADLGPDLVGICNTCLRKACADRFENAAELSTAIQACLAGQSLAEPAPRAVIAKPPEQVRRPGTRRRTALLAGVAAVTIGGVALLLPRPINQTHSFTFAGRRYEIVFMPLNRADAVAKAEQRSGRLASIDTAAELRAVAKAAIAADCGLINLWADRGTQASRPNGRCSALSIMSPVAEWTELDDAAVCGGFVQELDR